MVAEHCCRIRFIDATKCAEVYKFVKELRYGNDVAVFLTA
jgi:hypothetical protein